MLLNVGQQIGGSIGWAILVAVARSAVAASLRSQASAATAAKGATHTLTPAAAAALQQQIPDHALANSFSNSVRLPCQVGVGTA
jgi:hypothetical protein